MLHHNIKISNKESFIPVKLLDTVIKECDVRKIVIEEEQSELYFETYSGLGKILFKNNNIYEGSVRYGILESGNEGRMGSMVFNNGTKYEGEIHNNQISGKGLYNFPSGST